MNFSNLLKIPFYIYFCRNMKMFHINIQYDKKKLIGYTICKLIKTQNEGRI